MPIFGTNRGTGVFGARSQPQIEVRNIRARDVRAETRDGAQYLIGHAANFNVLSEDLGGWKERIKPGAFSRALREGQDVRHLINHDPTLILGRTKAGTTTLAEDAEGLAFRTKLGERTYERDLIICVERGDIKEGSFGFYARKQKWVVEDGIEVRELHDVDLLDISTVTYPAYPGTQATLDARAMFPTGMPTELRHRLGGRPGARRTGGELVDWRQVFLMESPEEEAKQVLVLAEQFPCLVSVEEKEEMRCRLNLAQEKITPAEQAERDGLARWARAQIRASESPLGL